MTSEITLQHGLTLRVQEAHYVAEHVLGLTLVDPAGQALPGWTPGAHIDIVLPSGATRSYSLCGEPGAMGYRIAVLHDPNGRGASREIHQTQLVGSLLPTSVPRNQFELVEAPHYVFIAGGIGVTPLMPMIRTVAGQRGSWEMHYLGRSRARMGFLADIETLATTSGSPFTVVARDERERAAMAAILTAAPGSSAVYCCGPDALIGEVEELCRSIDTGLDLHVERFGRPVLKVTAGTDEALPSADTEPESFAACDPDGPFQVELRQSNVVLDIRPGDTILGCARTVRTGLSFSCSDGYCGTCETPVIAGIPDHRDTVLTDDEKAENRSMMICVGRSRTRRLVLDL